MPNYRSLQITLQNLQIELMSVQDMIANLKTLDTNPHNVLFSYHGKKMNKMEVQTELDMMLALEQKYVDQITEFTLLMGVEEADE